ncbi:MAG: hypothetical protein ABIV21_05565 [Pyrinomonadaceae bacterium]
MTGAETASGSPISFVLDNYQLWGESLVWKTDDHRLNISFLTVMNGSTLIAPRDRLAVLAKWRSAFFVEMSKAKAIVWESPYTFGDFKGFEFRTEAPGNAITRVFFIKNRLFVIGLSAEDLKTVEMLRPILDSFRLLTKDERIIAMIEEFDPPALPQDHPSGSELAETEELGLKGAVRRIRDTYRPVTDEKSQIVQEMHFDQNGALLKEISFLEGFPDIITAWGWLDGKRVNIQSAVNYPDREGPQTGRTVIVSGYLPAYDTGKAPRFGNRIESELDENRRPLIRRRYSNIGVLIYSDRFSYSGKVREIKTTDSSNGFLGAIRETLDGQNHVTEKQIVSDNGIVFESQQFEYVLDEQKNWVEKKIFNKMGRGKATKKRLIGTYYRNIVYYTSADSKSIAILR